MPTHIDTTALDQIVTGRVSPAIYAFQTNTYPNYIKIGDTYRPVKVRLDEWRVYYEDLELLCTRPAVLDNGRYFRDYAIHDFLTRVKHLERLSPADAAGRHYSREFFKDAKESDIDEAICDIKADEMSHGGMYQFYSEDRRPVIVDYQRDTEPIELRDIQQTTVDNFVTAYRNNQTNLLMYAVMRFGKSITAMSCAVAMDARLVLIICGKLDVEDEWKRTVKKTANFDGYDFKNSQDLANGYSVTAALEANQKLVIFLSLQDLQGEDVKTKHKELFETSIDLIIVDETHFGARADRYGEILRKSQLKKKEIEQEINDLEQIEADSMNLKLFKYKVILHLSGTPYRILMSNNEFKPQDVIAFYQFTDIIKAQKEWDTKYLGEDGKQEWDNPYYGFPQMIRFAFKPNKAAQNLLERLKSNGITYAFAELFKPKSIIKDKDNLYRQFIHEQEILELFELIDGGSDKSEEGILSFLSYEPIVEGKMCRHIVIVLPFKASCDALEELLNKNKAILPNLASYNIVNIAGLNSSAMYPATSDVKRCIAAMESRNQKTITLTVNRMLTGTTVREWDTMIFFKDTVSPQDYDQAIFRIQTQYIKEYAVEGTDNGIKGNNIIKYNMKPQTVLVDFDPDRMMLLQELKSKFYNVNTLTNGNDQLEERIQEELKISPIITINQNKIEQVQATDIMELVRKYSHSKSILDEAMSISFDETLLLNPDIKAAIEDMMPIDASKGLNFRPYEENEDEEDDDNSNLDIETLPNDETASDNNDENGGIPENKKDIREDNLEKKLKTYYSLLLFFSFLSDSRIRNLRDIVFAIENDKNDERIARNIGLRLKIVKLFLSQGDAFIRSDLEYAIDHINSLMQNEDIAPLERVSLAIKKFNRISDSEVVTPEKVADELSSLLPDERINKDTVFLDIASIQGEMAVTLIKKFEKKIDWNKIYSLPTSRLSYELTRKIYSVLGLPIENVLCDVFSSDFIGEKNTAQFKRIETIHPSVIIGGPPFNSNDGGGRSGDSASALYHNYISRAIELSPDYISMVSKAVWYSGGKGTGLKEFRDAFISDKHIAVLSDYPDPSPLNFTTTLRGGVCVFLWDKSHSGKTKVINHINNTDYVFERWLRHKDINIFIRYNEGLTILDKVLGKVSEFYGSRVSSRNPFKIRDNVVKAISRDKKHPLKLYDVKKKVYYISRGDVDIPPDFHCKWKVLVAKTSPGNDELPHRIISEPIIAEPDSVCSTGLLVVSACNDRTEAVNLTSYMKTRFFRFMMILAKNAHNLTKDVYRFVPVMNVSKKWDDSSLYNYFGLDEQEQAFIAKVIREWDN